MPSTAPVAGGWGVGETQEAAVCSVSDGSWGQRTGPRLALWRAGWKWTFAVGTREDFSEDKDVATLSRQPSAVTPPARLFCRLPDPLGHGLKA